MLNVWTRAASNPSSTDDICIKLRSSSPAPDQQDDGERRLGDDEQSSECAGDADRRWRCRSPRECGRRRRAIDEVCQAGSDPNSSAATSKSPTVNATTVAVDAGFVEQRNPEPRLERGNALARPHRQREAGERRRAIASTTLSTSTPRTSRTRPAPSAVRIAISRVRPSARVSTRLATLTQTISSTKPTAPSSSSSGVPHVADQRAAHLVHRDALVAVRVRDTPRPGARPSARISSRARSSDASGLQPADHVQIMRAALRRQFVAR